MIKKCPIYILLILFILFLSLPCYGALTQEATLVDDEIFASSEWNDEFGNFYNGTDDYCEAMSIAAATIDNLTGTTLNLGGDIVGDIIGDITGTVTHAGTLTDSTIQASVLNRYNYTVYNHSNSATSHTVTNADFVAVDSSNEVNLLFIDSVTDANLNGTLGVAISGNYAYVASYYSGTLSSIDISDPANLSFIDSVTDVDLNEARSVAISGNYAYVASFDSDTLSSTNTAAFHAFLPAAPTLYNYFSVTPLGVTSGPIVLDPNGKKINGSTDDLYLSYTGTSAYNFTYINESSGWVVTNHGTK